MIRQTATFAVVLGLALGLNVMAAPQSSGPAQSTEKSSSTVNKPEARRAASGEATPGESATKRASAQPAASRLDLVDVTGVSTDRAVHSLAEQLASKAAKPGPASSASSAKPRERTAPAESAITEFHPVDPRNRGTGDPLVVGSSEPRKGKKIHGDAYGAAAPNMTGTNAAGGSVGVASKSGKTSVYVEGDQARATTGAPPH